MRKLRLGAAQINVTVGAIEDNTRKILDVIAEAERKGIDIVAFPELAITGYPPEDLLLKPEFVAENLRALEIIAARCRATTAVIGFVDRQDDLYDAAAVMSAGEVRAIYRKENLPNYGVFDEARYFRPGHDSSVLVQLRGVNIAVTVCEDVWAPAGPIARLARDGADLIVNVNASPFAQGKYLARQRMLSTRAADNSVAIFYVNLVGGQDELVFDGSSLLYDHYGELVGSGVRFHEELAVFELDLPSRYRKRLLDPRGLSRVDAGPARTEVVVTPSSGVIARSTSDGPALGNIVGQELELMGPRSAEAERGYVAHVANRLQLGYFDAAETYSALVLGTRDYVYKNGFSSCLVALSGGVDSALVATIAVDAVGPQALKVVGLPTRYSSKGSVDDAAELARRLGVSFESVSIDDIFESFLNMIKGVTGELRLGLTEENLQSRIRGTFMMALSNFFGSLVLTTGNKSELATGYSTLYGDTAGGFAVIKDVPKTHVYELCAYRNQLAGFELIPQEILTKAPSAELRPDQRDDDSLPSYDLLDPLLYQLIDLDMTASEVFVHGLSRGEVQRIERLVDRAEYKRRQSPPGVRLTEKSFGKDRRMPITNGS
ncbi:MAG: NAD+ synthase [Acidimicrobiales bacterium]